ncbi:MAG: DUF3822 family protein [Flavobacteriales bacterium]|nr:DUF3822 family protein [Flavobacteriales bacterium]
MRIAVASDHYDPERERAWHLSIWCSASVTGWAVHALDSGRCVAVHAAPGEDLPDMDRLPLRPARATFVALPEISTLVPESALTPGTEMQHLRLVHGSLPTGLLRDEPVEALGARCIYLHDEAAEHRLLKRFPAARPLSLQGLMVRNVMRHAGNGPVLLLHRTAQRVDLAVAHGGQVELSNAFHAVNGEDALYYALFALDRCGLKPADATVVIGGTHLNDTEVALLKDYLPQVKALPAAGNGVVNGLPIEHPERLAGLLDQCACAS